MVQKLKQASERIIIKNHTLIEKSKELKTIFSYKRSEMSQSLRNRKKLVLTNIVTHSPLNNQYSDLGKSLGSPSGRKNISTIRDHLTTSIQFIKRLPSDTQNSYAFEVSKRAQTSITYEGSSEFLINEDYDKTV